MEKQPQQSIAREIYEYIGIDLGTHFCSCAFYKGTSNYEMISFDNQIFMPSCINLFGLTTIDNACLIGSDPKDSEFSGYYLYDSKQIIGRELVEINKENLESWPFKVYKKGKSLVMCTDNTINGRNIELTPEQVTSILLRKIYAYVKRERGTNIGSVVIAIPTYFDDIQRQATLKASSLAGIECVKLINEPIATLLAYKNSFPNDFKDIKYSVVFDFRRTTLDVTVCEIDDINGRINVLGCGGDQKLGGSNFDIILSEIIEERIKDEYPEMVEFFEKQRNETGKDKKQKQLIHDRIKKSTEQIKIALSNKNMYNIPLQDIFKGILRKDGIDSNGEISILREDFEDNDKCKDLFERCENCLKKTIKECGLSKSDIDKVVLVGGSSKIPKVRRVVKDYFVNKNILSNEQFDPLTSIAKGAAFHAKDIFHEGFVKIKESIDNVPQSIGVEINQGKFLKIINKDSPIPVQQTITFPLKFGETQPIIRIYQGEGNFVHSEGMQFIDNLVLKNTLDTIDTTLIQITFRIGNEFFEASAIDLNDSENTTNTKVEMKDLFNSFIEESLEQIYEIIPESF